MPVWYHYRRKSRLSQDLDEGVLRPLHRFIYLSNGSQDLPEDARQPAIWGFHCPEPDICDTDIRQAPSQKDLHQIQKQAANGEALYLLEIQVAPEDQLFVADVSLFSPLIENPVAAPGPRDEFEAFLKEYNKKSAAYYDAYYHSLIPFSDYEVGQYKKPEVVCFSAIPLNQDRIRSIRKTDEFCPPPVNFDILELS